MFYFKYPFDNQSHRKFVWNYSVEACNKDGVRFLQLYILKDRKITELMVRLAEKYGFRGIVVTVDAQVIGKRIKD